jgi:outer membrane protein OmpA-like peptidoglycan-associated protein
MKMKQLVFIFITLSLVFSSCSNSKGFGKRRYTTNTYSKPKYKTTVYKGERGDKNVTIFNKKQAAREKAFVETLEKAEKALKLIEDQKRMYSKIDSTEKIKQIDEQLQKSFIKSQEIINNLNAINPNSASGHQQALTLASELNDLLYSQVFPMGELINSNKNIIRIGADISFKTGSAELTDDGKKEISKLIDSIKFEIEAWKKYMNHHNERIFKNDEFRSIVLINGYSDKQGTGASEVRKKINLELSETRAKAVAAEFEKQLNDLKSKYKLDFVISFVGQGENLPPSYVDTGKKADPNRRVSSISLVVGPKILLYNE